MLFYLKFQEYYSRVAKLGLNETIGQMIQHFLIFWCTYVVVVYCCPLRQVHRAQYALKKILFYQEWNAKNTEQ